MHPISFPASHAPSRSSPPTDARQIWITEPFGQAGSLVDAKKSMPAQNDRQESPQIADKTFGF
jgi:hypothetical protein